MAHLSYNIVSPSQALNNNANYYFGMPQTETSEKSLSLSENMENSILYLYFFKDEPMTKVWEFVDISLYFK